MRFPLRRPTPFTLFVVIMLSGIIVSTLLFRTAQNASLTSFHRTLRPYDGVATDAQKLYLAARTNTSDLLFKITFAVLAAVIGLQLSETKRAYFSERGIFSAAGLLLASVYAAFLFQIGVSRCMEASLDDVFGPVLNYPILCQFWFLFAGVVIVAAALFRRPRRATLTAVFVAVLACRAASAETAYKTCVGSWAQGHSIVLPATATDDAARLVKHLVVRQTLQPSDSNRCAVTATMLDEVRYIALRDGSPETGVAAGKALATVLRAARERAEAPNLSPGELVDQLMSIAEIWKVASGMFDIVSGKTLFVTVTDLTGSGEQWLGYTRLRLRLRPGRYRIRAADGTKVLYEADVALARNALVPIDAGPRP